MANKMPVEVVSATGHVFQGEADLVVASAEMGDIGVAAGHAPFISRIKPGEIRVLNDGEDEAHYYVSGGMIEVQPKGVTVLADTAIRASDLDEAEAIKAKERAEQAMQSQQDKIDYAKAQLEGAEAVAQLAAIRKLKKQ